MKRFLSIILVAFVMVASLGFAGCSKGDENYSLSGVVSNGGLGVIKDGYLYYINGGTTDLGAEKEEVITSTSIFKRKVDANGNPVAGETPQVVYRGVAGFSKGQIHIFGEYIYFTTPSSKISNNADRLTGRTSFARVKLTGEDYEVLYTTETEGNLSFEYYAVSDEEMFLVVLEGEELYSINLSKKIKKNVIAEEVASVVFTSTNGRGNGAEAFVYYTKAPDSTYLTQNGNIVYKATPDGKTVTKISSGETVTLMAIQYGYLYFSVDNIVYKSTTAAGLDKSNIVSYNAYSKYILLENGGIIGIDSENSKVVVVKWENGALTEAKSLFTDSSHTLMLATDEYLLAYNSSKVVYAVTLDGGLQTPKKLSDQKITTVGNYLTYEQFGDYLYYFIETTVKDANGNDVKITSLASINVEEAYNATDSSN